MCNCVAPHSDNYAAILSFDVTDIHDETSLEQLSEYLEGFLQYYHVQSQRLRQFTDNLYTDWCITSWCDNVSDYEEFFNAIDQEMQNVEMIIQMFDTVLLDMDRIAAARSQMRRSSYELTPAEYELVDKVDQLERDMDAYSLRLDALDAFYHGRQFSFDRPHGFLVF